jgi:hypothetical protein
MSQLDETRAEGTLGTAGAVKFAVNALNKRQWAMLIIASILCGWADVWVGSLLGVPREPHFNGSLLEGGTPITGVLALLVAVGINFLIGSIVAGTVEADAALFCCCIGLGGFAIHCGPIRPVLQYSSGHSVFLSMAVESALLAGMVVGGWLGFTQLLRQIGPRGLRASRPLAPNENAKAELAEKLSTLGVQMLAMAICETILLQNDAQAQSIAGLFVAGFLGSLAAYMFTPLGEGVWYWGGPLALGAIGYLLAYIGNDAAATGDVHGWAAALARATPLQYAGPGTAGALLGYWCSRRWAQPEGDAEETAETVI